MRPLAIVQAVGAFTGAGTSAARAIGSLRLALEVLRRAADAGCQRRPDHRRADTPGSGSGSRASKRLVTMAALALAECATKHDSPAAVLLCLPSRVDDAFVPARRAGRARWAKARFPVDHARQPPCLRRRPRCAVFQALAEAERLLSTRRVDAVYLGGADSLIDVEPLDRGAARWPAEDRGRRGLRPRRGGGLRVSSRPRRRRGDAGARHRARHRQRARPARRGPAELPGQGLAQAGRAALADARLLASAR